MITLEWVAGGVAIWVTGMWVAAYLMGRLQSYNESDAPFPQLAILLWPLVPVLLAVVGPCVLIGIGIYKGWQLGQSRRQVRKVPMQSAANKEIIEQ